MIDIQSEKDIEVLRRVAMMQEAENAHLHKRLVELTSKLAEARGEARSELQQELALLQEKLDRRVRELYGPSSEKSDKGSRDKDRKKKPRKGHGPRKQPELPIFEVIHKLDKADMICVKCGGVPNKMKGQFEVSEEILVVRREFHIARHLRQKYACRCGECVETALGPRKLIPGGRYSVSFAVETAISKYADHLPLARQVVQMARAGLTVTATTLWDQLWALSQHLLPIYLALRLRVLCAPVIGADETTWPLLDSKRKKWWAWSITSEDAVFYLIHPARSLEAAREILGGYDGTVMADGYETYEALRKEQARDGPGFALANCWAHARRKFVECAPDHPKAEEAVERIGQLYCVDKCALDEAERLGLDEEERLSWLGEVRDRISRRLVKELLGWMYEQAPLPKSGLGKAIKYAVGCWSGLKLFLSDPRISLDNNRTERGMRALAVGRKNHYGSKTKRGTEVAALFYSLIESAKLCGLNPVEYLTVAAERAIDNPGTVTLPCELVEEKKREREEREVKADDEDQP